MYSVLVLALVLTLAEAKVTLTRFENCDATDYPIKMTIKLRDEADRQVLEEATISTKVALGNNVKDVAEVFAKNDEGTYEHLIDVSENLCDAVNKYMGDFMHDIQEAAGLARGTCPVPAGDYKIKEHPLDFNNFKFKKVPDGEFRVKVSLKDSATDAVLHCHFLEFTIAK